MPQKKRVRNYKKEGVWQSSAKQRAYRAKLNRIARAKGVYGKRASRGVDLSHNSDGSISLRSAHLNRSANGKGGRRRYL